MALGDFAQPGGGSEAGDFVRLANGAMVPRNHPLAIAELGPQTGVQANTMARQPEPMAIAPTAAPVLTAQPGLPAMGTPEGPYGNPKNLGGSPVDLPAMSTPEGPYAPHPQDLGSGSAPVPGTVGGANLGGSVPVLQGSTPYGGSNTGITGGMNLGGIQGGGMDLGGVGGPQSNALGQPTSLGTLMQGQWGKPRTAPTALGSSLSGLMQPASPRAFKMWGT